MPVGVHINGSGAPTATDAGLSTWHPGPQTSLASCQVGILTEEETEVRMGGDLPKAQPGRVQSQQPKRISEQLPLGVTGARSQ